MKKVLLKILVYGLLVQVIGFWVEFLLWSPQKTEAALVNLDTTFGGGNGYVTWGSPGDATLVESVQIQSDGKYVMTGYMVDGGGASCMAIWRYNSDGTLDTTFGGGNGYVTWFGVSFDDYGYSLQIQSDGKYVVAGRDTDIGGEYDLAIWRYDNVGNLDPTFGGGNGYVTWDGGNWEIGYSLQIQLDGKYVVAGTTDAVAGAGDLIIWRYDNVGNLDPTFGGGNGYVTWNGGIGTDEGYSLQIQSDGKYVITGFSKVAGDYDMAIWRYNSVGTLDPTFGGGNGYVTWGGGVGSDEGHSLLIQSDGKYLVGGIYTSVGIDMIIWRYNSGGTLDTSFGGTGYVTWDGGVGVEIANSLQIEEADGSVVATGYVQVAGGLYDLAIWRYKSDGSPDISFNGSGVILQSNNPGLGLDAGSSLLIQSDGKYFVAGGHIDGAVFKIGLWRYENKYQISNLAAGLEAKSSGTSIRIETVNGVYGSEISVTLEKSNLRVADIIVDMRTDRNWSGILADTDLDLGKAVASGVSSAPGVSSSYSLYVRKLLDSNGVRICPGAATLAGVTNDCQGNYILEEGNDNLSLVLIDDLEFWKIDGLTSTGAMNAFEETILPETGADISLLQKYF